MFITLTNAKPPFTGKLISINSDSIVTMHENEIDREDGRTDQVTFIFIPPHGTWEVKETLAEILRQLNQ
jgi:hypothetical protein